MKIENDLFASISDAAFVLRALNHPLRQSIALLLNQKKELVVSDIMIRMRLDQSTTSQHLATMRREKVVKTRRSGKFVYYSLDETVVKKIGALSKLLNAA
jgi:ArsR family transcriptional regulator, virulence genes transcriptional regulator